MKSLRKHLRSYKFAFRGIGLAFRHENNMRYHLLAAGLVILSNILLHVSRTDWLITLVLIGICWSAEVFNTSIEKLADRVTRENDMHIGMVKDLSAAAVLIICLFAAICGVIIYLSYIKF